MDPNIRLHGRRTADRRTDTIGAAIIATVAGTSNPRLSTIPTSDLADLIRRAVDELSDRGTHEAFRALLEVLPHAGERLGHAARNLAADRSWSEVAELSGTTKQAAWSRWRG